MLGKQQSSQVLPSCPFPPFFLQLGSSETKLQKNEQKSGLSLRPQKSELLVRNGLEAAMSQARILCA